MGEGQGGDGGEGGGRESRRPTSENESETEQEILRPTSVEDLIEVLMARESFHRFYFISCPTIPFLVLYLVF